MRVYALILCLCSMLTASASANPEKPTTQVAAQPTFTVIHDNAMGCALIKVQRCTLGTGFPLKEFSLHWLAKWEQEHADRVFLSVHCNACEKLMTEKPDLPLELVMRYSFKRFYPESEYNPPVSVAPDYVSRDKGYTRSYERTLTKRGDQQLSADG